MAENRPRAPLLRLIAYAGPRRQKVAWACFGSVAKKFVDLAPPGLIGAAVDVVVNRGGSAMARLGIADPADQLAALAGLTVLLWVLESGFEYFYRRLWGELAQSIQHDLRMDAYARVQSLDLATLEGKATGNLLSILNDDVNQLERFLDDGANELLQVATTVAVVGVAFFSMAPGLATLAILPIPVILAGTFAYQARIAPRYAAVRAQAGQLGGQLANNLGGIATIKSFTAEDFEVERIRTESGAYQDASRHALALASAYGPLIRVAVESGFTVTLLWGGWMTLDGRLAVGSYSVLVFLTQRMLWPLTRLGNTFDLYQRAMASATRVLDLLDLVPHLTGGTVRLPRDRVAGRIRFERVGFAYQPGHPVLQDLDLEIAPGETVGLVGATGAGKSTLVKLLLRFYDPTAGRITLDGVDLRELDLHDLRRAIGLVAQDVFLFPGSVAENVAYGSPRATRDSIEDAAKKAEAHGFVSGLPKGYETVVGERGQKLSGGQRQRLTLARAVLKDPPILVLDEATSAVDNETEAAIQRSLARVTTGRTTILIAHRLSTLRGADRIFVLDRGRVAEVGRHDELLARGGIYAGLWAVQTGALAGVRTAGPAVGSPGP